MMRCEGPTRPSVKNGNPKVSQLHPLERDGSSVRGNALHPLSTLFLNMNNYLPHRLIPKYLYLFVSAYFQILNFWKTEYFSGFVH